MDITIRHVEPEDYPQIRDLHTGWEAINGTLQQPFVPAKLWQDRLSSPPSGMFGLVALVDDRIVGHVGFQVFQNPRRKHAGEFGIVVHDDYAGHGIGSHLMSAMINMAENWLNISRIELTVFIDNTAAIHLYQKFGFDIEGESRNFAFRNGQYVNVYHMARIRDSG